MRGTYLYAVVAEEAPLSFAPTGLPDGFGVPAILPCGEHSAVVSSYDGPDFRDLPRTDLLGRLIVHQRVIEGAMTARSVLPVKFGSVLASQAAVRAALTHFHGPLANAMAEVKNTVECDLSASWDLSATFTEIAREQPVAAAAGVVTSGAPEKSLEERLQVGMRVQQALERRRETYRRRVVDDLVSCARDTLPIPLPSDEIVFNLAFLVDRDRLDQFDAAVDALAGSLDRLTFRYVGPLPPYSFAMVEFTHADPAEIEAARQVLGLGERLTEASLKARYRQLAAQCHPDRMPDESATQTNFRRITAAYSLLAWYIRTQRSDEAQAVDGREYDLATGTVAETVLLEIKRADTQGGAPSGVGNEPAASL